jgi:hypothetical protein
METSLFLSLYWATSLFLYQFAAAGVIRFDLNYATKVTKKAYICIGLLLLLLMAFQLAL